MALETLAEWQVPAPLLPCCIAGVDEVKKWHCRSFWPRVENKDFSVGDSLIEARKGLGAQTAVASPNRSAYPVEEFGRRDLT